MKVLCPPTPKTKTGLVPSILNPAWTAGLEGDTQGLYASIQLDAGTVLELSKMEGETAWTIDASYTSGGLPHYVNGYGARYLRSYRLADEMAALVDKAAL